ncbi:MAG: tetratricopeptide repeat protein, partial [Blastocatellia bacterium]|nr:tetratricopeptide repeat protein [Blastocatellia bacterium]
MIKASLLAVVMAIIMLAGYAFQSSGQEAPALQRRLEKGEAITGDLTSGRSGLARAKTTLAAISLKLGETQQALDLYREALQITRRIHDPAGEIMALNGLGHAYHELGDDLIAIDNADQALQIAEKTGNSAFQMTA